MSDPDYSQPPRRKRVNLTVREDVMKEAKELGLNASKAAEAGIKAAVREEKGRRWLAENREAIEAHKRRIEREGVLLPPAWLDEI
ncbi:type II toxin-antitoxin system CcdA family antitoxin [Maricaulis sp.]|uniref:type II toxin-antitoxin system CcdA family antitoxin n=1 Tax=Maricaulis sp. TaxID=1486257 RepID=UPI002620CD29|nr:type II toxin-antitoxin system CcdA family antitoxin [Maricaulis sp.]